MKTCVLFPKAFTYNYMDGSAAHVLDLPSSYELYLNPEELHDTGIVRKRIRRGLSLLTNHRVKPKAKSRKKRLLHVEDNPQIRLIVSIFLKNHFEIDSVESGEEALRQVRMRQYDFILMDVNLGPGMDGFEASRKIRTVKNYESVPIVALTANDYDEVRDECIYSRVNAYIQKPFEKSYLLGTIQEIDKHMTKENLLTQMPQL